MTSDIVDKLQNAKTFANIIVLDACRSDDLLRKEEPSAGIVTRAGTTHKQAMLPIPRLAPQTITAFACNVGMSALDGPKGGNGMYTRALLDSLKRGTGNGTRIVDWLALATKLVMERTAAMAHEGFFQIPSFTTSMTPELLALTL